MSAHHPAGWPRAAWRWAAAVLALGAFALPVQAGRSCEAQAPTALAVQRGLNLAVRVEQALDASGAQVVVLARAGQDLSRHGLQWSHLAYAVRGDEGWRVVHKLNTCGSDQAGLFREGLGEFFLDDPWRFLAAYAVPTPELQARLLALLRGPQADLVRLHEPAYNLVAYPWSTRYQQSNQWLIETLALAAEPTVQQRAQAQAWLRFKGYEPTVLTVGAFERLGARMTAANVAFDDHPNGERFSDRIATASADSVFVWLRRAQLAGAPVVVR